MRKFLLAILSCVILACSGVFMLTACNDEDATTPPEENRTIFTIQNCAITGLTDYGKTLSEVVIPESIDGVTITEIKKDAFSNNGKLVSVVMPNTIETLGWSMETVR